MDSSGDRPDASDPHRRKTRYHRHTGYQIQRLEAVFKGCPHPDENTRNQLSRELSLHPRQIKFWFQNRRTQMKTQYERADNCALKAENDKIRCENIAISEALKHVICPSCGGPPLSEDSYFDERKLHIENAQLREKLDRISSIASKYIGRPLSYLPPIQPNHIPSLDLSMASFGVSYGISGPPPIDLDLDLLRGSSSGVLPNLPLAPTDISGMDKSVMADISANAMDGLIRLLQSNEPLWIKSADGRETLNLEGYERIFQNASSRSKTPGTRVEASRDSCAVVMNGLALVDVLMDENKYVDFFPTIVSRAKTIEVISRGMLGSHSGTLQLMYEELQVLSALVPTRQLYFLRLCQQIERGSWAIVDVSYDVPHRDSQFSSSSKSRRLPSGCLVQDMPNGYSKVTWVEHWEVEDNAPVHRLYRDLIHSGFAFGAERWLSNLQRMSERFALFTVSGNSTHDLGDVIPSPEGKRSIMKLAQRMVKNFCSSINPSNGQKLASELNGFEVIATLHRSTDPVQANAVALSAAATICLPVPMQSVFNFLRDERTRSQWDALSNQGPVQEIARIANGSHPGNSISVLRALTTSQNMLILQESCVDASGALVVYCPIDLPALNMAMSGEDPSYIPLLPLGFAISSDGRLEHFNAGVGGGGDADEASTSSNQQYPGIGHSTSGSLITVVYQMHVSNLPTARINPESITTANNLISTTIHQIKAALNCTTTC